MGSPPFEQSSLLERPKIRHGFFGRQSGLSSDAGELDVSESLGGAPETIATNRQRVVAALNSGALPLAGLRQTHSTNVISLARAPENSARPEADGIVTALPGVALGILTADCAPLIFADPTSGVIGACHAGWKGAVGGVIGNTIATMETLGARRENIIAAIGPTISGANYEVGPEFADSIVAINPSTATHLYIPDGSTRTHFDLPGFAAEQVLAAGIEQLDAVGGCTYQNPTRYFSHRHTGKHQTPAGRQIAIIALI